MPLSEPLDSGDVRLKLNKTGAESSTLVYNQSDAHYADSRYGLGQEKETLQKDLSINKDSGVVTQGVALSNPNEQVSSFKNSHNVQTITQQDQIDLITRGLDIEGIHTDQTAQHQSGTRPIEAGE